MPSRPHNPSDKHLNLAHFRIFKTEDCETNVRQNSVQNVLEEMKTKLTEALQPDSGRISVVHGRRTQSTVRVEIRVGQPLQVRLDDTLKSAYVISTFLNDFEPTRASFNMVQPDEYGCYEPKDSRIPVKHEQ